MSQLLVALVVTLLCLQLRYGALLSPATAFVLSCGVSVFAFYMVDVLDIYPAQMRLIWFVKASYAEQRTAVLASYIGLIALAMIADRVGRGEARVRRPLSVGPRMLTPSAALVDRPLLSPAALGALLAVIALVAVHAFAVDFGKLIRYNTYLSAHTPEEVGISNPAIGTLHRILPILGCLMAPLAAHYLVRKKYSFAALAGVPCLYALFLSTAFDSRFSALQILLFGAAFQLAAGRRISLMAVMSVVVAFVWYATIMTLRRTQTASGTFGITPFVGMLMQFQVPANIFLLAILNFFPGGVNLAEAYSRTSFVYSLKYKFLSFSPLPSLIDGFDKIRDTAPKAAATAPFGNFSQAYSFGFLYSVAFLVLLFLALRQLARTWYRLRGPMGFLIMVPAYYSLLRMHAYPIRTTMRWLVLSVVLGVVAERYLRKRGQRARREERGPQPTGATTRGLPLPNALET